MFTPKYGRTEMEVRQQDVDEMYESMNRHEGEARLWAHGYAGGHFPSKPLPPFELVKLNENHYQVKWIK